MAFLAIKYSNNSIQSFSHLSSTLERFINQNIVFFLDNQIREEFKKYVLSEVSKSSYESWKILNPNHLPNAMQNSIAGMSIKLFKPPEFYTCEFLKKSNHM
jgi:hypothetical protein